MSIRNLIPFFLLLSSLCLNIYLGIKLAVSVRECSQYKTELVSSLAAVQAAQMLSAQQALRVKAADEQTAKLRRRNSQELETLRGAKISRDCKQAIRDGIKLIHTL